MLKSILGVKVNLISRTETVGLIEKIIENGKLDCRLVVTAYSEFFVEANRDRDFMRVLTGAEMVTPDGVSVLAAARYLERTVNAGLVKRLFVGLSMGGDIVSGNLEETVTGVYLFEELSRLAEKKDWKVFLLGGWDGVASRSVEILLERFPKLRVDYDAGERQVGQDADIDRAVIEKINKFKPDILFVAYNPVKQEKWIASHRRLLKAGVAIGVGGTFDEFVGDKRSAPGWMEKMGLKWLWRLILEPKRWRRIWRAVVVFPWMVFNRS